MPQAAIDPNAFDEMKEMMGDSFMDVVSMCLQSLPEQNAELALAIANDDAEQTFNIAHRLKSSCGSIGAFGLAEKIEVIERIGRDGSTQAADIAYTELQITLQEVLSYLKNESK